MTYFRYVALVLALLLLANWLVLSAITAYAYQKPFTKCLISHRVDCE